MLEHFEYLFSACNILEAFGSGLVMNCLSSLLISLQSLKCGFHVLTVMLFCLGLV